ncbi:MAG: hypothetical protein WCH99_19255 [Verrucomicrobiota bacterium]
MKKLYTLIIGLCLALTSLGGTTNATTTASGEPLLMRTYKISADTFVRNLKQLAPSKSGESNQDLLVRFFKDKHIETEKPAAVFLDEKRDRLHVRMTKADQDKVELLIQEVQTEPKDKVDAKTTDVPAKFAFITKKTTLQQVIDRLGKCDRVRGKGGAYYEYDLPDGAAVLVCPEAPYQLTNRIGGVTYFESTNYIVHLPKE